MNIFLETFKTDKIDIANVDIDSFSEGLLNCVSETEKNCKLIDEYVTRIAITPYTILTSTMELYDAITELTIMKNRLLFMCNLFRDWYENLPEKYQQLYTAYFVDKDVKTCQKIAGHAYTRTISCISKKYFEHVKKTTKPKLNAEELLDNPFVYNSYMRTLLRKQHEGRGHYRRERREVYDSSRDEECYC